MGVPLWIRHVVVPGLTDGLEAHIRALGTGSCEPLPQCGKGRACSPSDKLCLEKYQQMGIPFPLEGTDNLDDRRLEELVSQL